MIPAIGGCGYPLNINLLKGALKFEVGYFNEQFSAALRDAADRLTKHLTGSAQE
jgi:hypothetical protein